MNYYFYNDFKIEVRDEPTYRYDSADNNFNYAKIYFGENAQDYPTSRHGIRLYRADQIVDSAIIIGSGSATGIRNSSSLLDNDRLVICCCNNIFCLSVPTLELKWKTEADLYTCFQIFKYEATYIIQGELYVSKIDRNGHLIWKFGGPDIFVDIDKEAEFIIENDGILLTDFAGTKYRINFDGKLLWDTLKRLKENCW